MSVPLFLVVLVFSESPPAWERAADSDYLLSKCNSMFELLSLAICWMGCGI